MSSTTPSSSSTTTKNNSAITLPVLPTKWADPTNDAVTKCIPTLSSKLHKGSSGRIGILGGSKRYTGAPYYAAMASLKVGADLAYVFCAEEAALPIKCYSPELMVASVYKAAEFDKAVEDGCLDKKNDGDEERVNNLINKMVKEVTSLFDKMHALIIGPGLGRCPLVLRATAQIIRLAREQNLPLVIDADGLFLLTMEEYKDLVKGYKGVVLTPNVIEHKRLIETNDGTAGFESALEGTVVVKKGKHDEITAIVSSRGDDVTDDSSTRGMVCEEQGGLKRSGGIGDILAGTLGTFVGWNRILHDKNNSNDSNEEGVVVNEQDLPLACWSACCVVKRAARIAFEAKRRAMTAPDVLEELGSAMDDMTSESIDWEDHGIDGPKSKM